MPQGQLPIFATGLTLVNNQIGFEKRNGSVYYFHGHLPLFQHDEGDAASFRLITSQIVNSGTAKQVEIAKAFGVSAISIKRYVKILREKGPAGFFEEKRRRGTHVLKEDVLAEAQNLLTKGEKIPAVAEKLNIKSDTLRKAVRAGRLKKGFNFYSRQKNIRQERKECQRQPSGHGTGLYTRA